MTRRTIQDMKASAQAPEGQPAEPGASEPASLARPQKNGPGCRRTPVLDEFKKREILAILTMGCSRRTAARYVGCAPATIRNTADREPEFAEQLRRAESKAEISLMKNIQKAASKEQYWRAAAWALERKNPEEFAPRSPDVVTLQQITQLLAQLQQIILEEVPVARYRKKIIQRIGALTAEVARARKPHTVENENSMPDVATG
ncbi:MAG: hypothetical protein ACUVUC_14280 [Thermoguttaceae bacterium]